MKNNHDIKLLCCVCQYVPFSTLSMSEFRGYEKFLYGVITVSIFVSHHLRVTMGKVQSWTKSKRLRDSTVDQFAFTFMFATCTY